ncbi:MAG: response regulator [Candidatus Hydrothermarchaeales archaeon]
MVKILVVDDDPQICEQLSEILTNYGHEVKYETSGERAMRLEDDYDIILLDLVMPKVDGFYLLSHFKRVKPRAQVIMITAFATVESAVEAMRRGATDYISKPFRSKQIETAIQRAMEETNFGNKLGAQKKVVLDTFDDEIKEVLNSLANPLRHGILELLKNQGKSSFTKIKDALAIEDSPKLSFHLKKLTNSGLLEQGPDKNYRLSEKGEDVVETLEELKGKMR